jgi:hypothetical protein
MGARAGQNNFKRHQRDAVATGMKKLKLALSALPRRTRFDSFHALARYVANAAGMHPTTVGRNPRYRQIVWDYIQGNPAVITHDQGQTTMASESGAAEAASRLDAGLLRRDNDRLRKMLAILSEQKHPNPATALPTEMVADIGHLRHSFERTATILARVLDWAAEREIGLVADIERGEILDEAEIGKNRVIVARPDTTAFFYWMKHNSGRTESDSQA